MINKKLEQKDWTEWVPIYGIYKGIINHDENKQNTLYKKSSNVQNTYQAISIGLIGIGLYKLAEKLF